ncbi:MAG TPA: FxSxx-COOH system tetratricopeptide repeat protein [Actinospica sp.]|jgi:hypothetical protein|nr:FxSxx-COOH system tetratricopeptide repeat protein [Actinospica sp.]
MPDTTTEAAAVFISFRNKDGEHAAAVLRAALAAHYGESVVFRSTDSIEPGDDYRRVILGNLEGCVACVAVIGPYWSGMRGADGGLRLFEEHDWVRAELSIALQLDKKIIPVLLDQVPRLSERDLPPDLWDLAGLQSLRMTHYDHSSAIRRLIKVLTPLPGTADRPPICRLPPAEARYVERPALSTALESAMAAASGQHAQFGTPVPVVLSGAVGTGKSVLAAEYARRAAGRYAAVWWIDARDPRTLGARLTELAAATGLGPGWDAATGVPELFDRIARSGRWLVVFDGVDEADAPDALLDLLTAFGSGGSGGDVLITSRIADWGLAAVQQCPVELFAREESVELLSAYLPNQTPDTLDGLAAAMGDLPLAVAQSAALVKAGWFRADDLARRAATAPGALLANLPHARTRSRAGAVSVVGAWSPVLDRIESGTPRTRRILGLLGVLAPAAVPLRLFTEPGSIPDGSISDGSVSDVEAVAMVADSGLVPVRDGAFHAHPLFQSFVLERIGAEHAEPLREQARVLLAAADPGDPRDLRTPAGYDVILPHVLALDFTATSDPDCRALLLRVAHHLAARGDAVTAGQLATAAYEKWKNENHDTLVLGARAEMARALFRSGDPSGAARIDRELVAVHAAAEGPDGPATLRAELDLATDLSACGDFEASTAMLERLIRRLATRFGPDSRERLRAVHNAAHGARALGRSARALRLDEPNLRALADVLGPDHPDTLRSAYALGLDLRVLGDPQGALVLHQDTYERLAELYGADHAAPLEARYAVAVDLRLLRDPRVVMTAYEVCEDSTAVLGPDHVDALTRRLFYGEVLRAHGRQAEGDAECARARRGLRGLSGPGSAGSASDGLGAGRVRGVGGGLLGGRYRSDEEL